MTPPRVAYRHVTCLSMKQRKGLDLDPSCNYESETEQKTENLSD